MGNSDEASGDGWKYRGRGLIQLTGKNNYTAFATSIDTPIEEVTEYLQTIEGCVRSACWFWQANNLNQYADAGDVDTMTKRINGGLNGIDDRRQRQAQALQVLGA
jgi:putative chitinase